MEMGKTCMQAYALVSNSIGGVTTFYETFITNPVKSKQLFDFCTALSCPEYRAYGKKYILFLHSAVR